MNELILRLRYDVEGFGDFFDNLDHYTQKRFEECIEDFGENKFMEGVDYMTTEAE